MLERYHTSTAIKITVTRNKFGDFTTSAPAGTPYKCRFEENQMVIKTGNNEEITTDGLAWFAPDVPIADNDVFIIDGIYYKVIKWGHAKKLGGTAIQFHKVWVQMIKPDFS